MLRHYFMMAARSFARHKLYSFINIFGLAVALTCAILILLFIRYQLSYDDWIPDTENLYRLEVTFRPPGRAPVLTAMCPFPVLTAVGERIPGVQAVTHVVPEKMTVTAGARQFLETVTVVDPDFFQVVKLPLVEGDPAHVLAQPESIVLSEAEAHKYFGDKDPVGRILTVSGVFHGVCKASDSSCFSAVRTLTVTGVLRDLPQNTQLIANLVMPNTSRADQLPQSYKDTVWTGTLEDYGYVKLHQGVEPAKILAALKPILDGSIDVKRNFGANLKGSQLEQYHLTPFRDAHLTSDQYQGMRPGGSLATVYGFAAVALLIVLVASCNFMNLATARATLRAREIALRKVAGAKRHHLIVQFLGEAVLTILVSLAIALSVVEMVLPLYDHFLGEPISLYPADWKLLAVVSAGAIVIGLLSGIYPALVLSAFRPASSLKTGRAGQTGSGLLRSALVVGQFAVSIGLGIAVIVVFRQISFARSLSLGYDPNDLVVVRGTVNLPPTVRERLERDLRSGPGIAGTTLSNAVPFDLEANNLFVAPEGETPHTTAEFLYVSPSFPSLYGIRLLAGRLLSENRGTDVASGTGVHNVLINAVAANRFGYSPTGVVGKMLIAGKMRMKVVGVLGNTIIDGLRGPVQPSIFLVSPEDATLLSVRVRAAQLTEALSYLDRVWHSVAPGVAMDRYFLSNAFNELLQMDEQAGSLFAVFVGVAVLIACLGLFGLAVFTADRRTMEIGIRKVAGAHARDIVRLMLLRISVPVLVANVVAWPGAYYYLNRWLEGYAYRVSLNPGYFLAGAVAALMIAWMTVLAHALRLARTNPIHALRYE